MHKPKPIIKDNNGRPVALCNKCFCMMCYVSLENKKYVISEVRGTIDYKYISSVIGQEPPAYCDKCDDLLFKYSLNE